MPKVYGMSTLEQLEAAYAVRALRLHKMAHDTTDEREREHLWLLLDRASDRLLRIRADLASRRARISKGDLTRAYAGR